MIGWVILGAVVAAAAALLVHDFMAGLGEDRQWSDPSVDDPQSFVYRSRRAEQHRVERVSMDSVRRLYGAAANDEADRSGERREAWPA